MRKPLYLAGSANLMSSLEQALLDELGRRDVVVEPDVNGEALLRVRAADPVIGDLLIWSKEGEIIVGLDKHRLAHSHFDQFSVAEDLEAEEMVPEIAAAAASFISAFLRDEYVVEFVTRESGASSVSTVHRDHRTPRKGIVRALVWSGELKTQDGGIA